MNHLFVNFSTLIASYIFNFFSNMDGAYMDIFKIFAGSIGWIGGLALFMWIKDKNKKKTSVVAVNA